MIKSWLRLGGMAALTAAALGLAGAADASTVTVYSINTAPGDWETGSGDATVTIDSAAGWYYTGLRTGGAIGIRDNFPRNGNGSAYIQTTSSNGKAYITHLYDANSYQSFTSLSKLTYDWLVDDIPAPPAGPADGKGGVAFKLLVALDGDIGELVWEPAENGKAVTAGSGWQTSDVLANSSGNTLWTSSPTLMAYLDGIGGGGLSKIGGRYWGSLNKWNTVFANAQIVGFSAGLGGGGYNGNFVTATDNITIGFGGAEATTYNFEVRAVPEPGSIVMGLIAGGLGLAGAAWRRRRVG